MKPRVLEILKECDRLSDISIRRYGVGQWMQELEWVLTFDEKREILALWNTMPGYATYFVAFCEWAGGFDGVSQEAHRLYVLSQAARNKR